MKRYSNEQEKTLLFACYLHDNLESVLLYKDKLEKCSIEIYGVRKSIYLDINERSRILPLGIYNRHRLSIPNSGIRIQIPGINVGVGKLRSMTVPQEIKILETHIKFKDLSANQLNPLYSKHRDRNAKRNHNHKIT